MRGSIDFLLFDEKTSDTSDIKKLLSICVYAAEEKKLNRILKTYSTEDQSIILAFFGQKLVGLIGFDLSGTILHIAVDPAFRHQGIAREMINHISTRFSKLKAEADNEGVGFYKTRVVDKKWGSFERDFLSDLKIFPKPIAKSATGEEKFLKDGRKAPRRSPISYPQLALQSMRI